MAFNIKISFKKSRSKNFNDVLRNARKFKGFCDDSEPYYLIIDDANELFSFWENFNAFYNNVKKWTGTHVHYDNLPQDLNSFFYALQDIYLCYYRQCRNAFDKLGFCDESEWGCHNLKTMKRFIDMPGYGIYWYKYGHYSDENTWVIDKDQIKQLLLTEAELKCLHVCPRFSVAKITRLLKNLPDSIYIDGENWHKVYKTDYLANGPVKIPVSIIHGEFKIQQDPEEYKYDSGPTPIKNITGKISNAEADRLIEEYLKNKDKDHF